MDMKLEVVFVPVTDVDRAKAFYVDQVGFNADHDIQVNPELRFVQLTPPGSACSVVMGVGVTQMTPGSQQGVMMVVADGRVVGMMNLAVFERMPRPGHPASYWGYLANAFVLAEHRNQGIGRRLIAAAVDHAARNDFARVIVSPSERSIPFYERAGFGPADVLMVRGRRHAG
jgi:ribosomal protein S18 acetylase RimI-like enzyme